MELKVGDKVRISPHRREFYKSAIHLDTYMGTFVNIRPLSMFAEVMFDGRIRSVLSADLEKAYAKGEQLLFSFMSE